MCLLISTDPFLPLGESYRHDDDRALRGRRGHRGASLLFPPIISRKEGKVVRKSFFEVCPVRLAHYGQSSWYRLSVQLAEAIFTRSSIHVEGRSAVKPRGRLHVRYIIYLEHQIVDWPLVSRHLALNY